MLDADSPRRAMAPLSSEKPVPLSPKPTGFPPGLQQRSAPFSVHSRGIQLCDRDRLYDCQYAAMAAFRSLRDISGSLFGFLLIQGWLSVYVTIITICSVTFYDNIGNGRKGFIDWTLPAFAVFLPLLFILGAAYFRREKALHELALVKSLLVAIAGTHRTCAASEKLPEGHWPGLQLSVHTLVDAMRNYFLPPRFYSRDYPFTGVKSKMMRIAQDRARQVRRLQASFRQLQQSTEVLRRGGVGEARLVQLAQWHLELQTAFERMANVKEYRTPQGLRVLVRCYVALVIPVFYGPYFANLGRELSFAFGLVFAVVFNLAVVGVLQTTLSLEDPYDNVGLDGIYVDEALFEAEQAISLEDEKEPVSEETYTTVAPPAGPPGGQVGASSAPLPQSMDESRLSQEAQADLTPPVPTQPPAPMGSPAGPQGPTRSALGPPALPTPTASRYSVYNTSQDPLQSVASNLRTIGRGSGDSTGGGPEPIRPTLPGY